MDTHEAAATSPMRLGTRVDCVTRTNRVSAYRRIRAIGGVGQDGLRWRLSEDAAIVAIETQRAAFYVESPPGRRVEIVVAQGLGRRYLKTEADGESPDRLLGLPDCV